MAAPHQVIVVPEILQWRYAPLDAEVTCPRAVLETIRQEAVEGLGRLSHGGLEIGGLLLGRRTDHSIEIVAALPISCEHKLGPLFILSTADERALDAALSTERPETLRPVGLYVSHSRRGFSVADSDAAILDRHLPELWQVAVVVMPTKTGPARTGFFIRESIERPFVCVNEIMLAAGHHRSAPAAGPAPKPVIAIPAEPAATSVSPTLLDRLHAFLGSFVEPFVWPLLEHCKKYLRLSQWNLPAAVILLVLFVLAGGLWVRARGLTGAAVPMRVSDLGSNLRIEWDANQKAVRAALAATLEIHDGARKPLSIPLTRSALEHGSVLYIPQSDNLQASLKLIQRNGLMSESVIYFINPTRPAPQPSSTPVTPDIAAAIVPGQPVPATPVEEIGPPATRQKKPAPKVFRPPDSQPVAAAPLRASLNLPDAPDIPAAPAPAPTLSSALLAATPRLTGPPQLRTGHLIWTGSLRKNTVLTLTPDGASTGVLNGRLPGVPVKINVQPAELTDTGIAVYSNDRERSGAGGQPSTWNGWNVMVYYDWDPKKIAQLDVVEPPGPANNWKRLVLRNGGRNASVLVVNWQRAEGR